MKTAISWMKNRKALTAVVAAVAALAGAYGYSVSPEFQSAVVVLLEALAGAAL